MPNLAKRILSNEQLGMRVYTNLVILTPQRGLPSQ
jgi:hypothetical protein